MPAVQDAAFIGSLTWIMYRIWQIYKIPVDDLVSLLGLDIPPVPEVSLAGITSDSVVLYWKPPDQQYASMVHSIHVNGIQVGEMNKGETAVQVTGLKPNHFYNIRVIASTPTNFSTLGQLIRLRTSPFEGSKADEGAVERAAEGMDIGASYEAAAVRPAPVQYESAISPPLARESSGGTIPARRTASGPRHSPQTQSAEQSPSNQGRAVGTVRTVSEDSVECLSRKHDMLRQEIQDLEKQMQEEESQSKVLIVDLTAERDQLKQTTKEREDATAELRKQGNHLDKVHRLAQSRRAQTEHSLNQKKAERRKMQDDVARWEKEISDMRQNTQDIITQKAGCLIIKDSDALEIRRIIMEEQAVIKELEEDIRATGVEILNLEKDRQRFSDAGDEVQQFAKQDRDDEEGWETQAQAKQGELGRLWQALQQLNAEYVHHQKGLAWWMAKHARDPSQFAPISGLEYAPSIRSNRSRRNKQSNSRTSTISSPSAGYSTVPTVFSPMSTMSTTSPTYSLTAPTFNIANGTIAPPPIDQTSTSQADTDLVSGSGPMSPTADGLLPSNLFRDEDAMARRISASAARESFGSLGSDVLARHADSSSHGPHTPVSSGSRNGSQFSSPRDSLQHIPSYSVGGDSYADIDRRSLNSNGASVHSPIAADNIPLPTNRLGSFLTSTFTRQRGKPDTNDPPLLGTLRQGQSQSFPRKYEQELGPVGVRQRRGSRGWSRAKDLLNQNNPGDVGIVRSLTGSGKKSRLNTFGPNIEGLQPSIFSDRPTSARPSSISSFDQVIGRPSSESQRTPWGIIPDTMPNRSSPLGANWPNASQGIWSRNPSRRPSVQHGSTSNISTSELSLHSTPLEPDYQGGPNNPGIGQLPIGTRPRAGSSQPSQRPVTPKLNPAAPSFKTLFGRGDAKKAARADKAAEKIRDKETDVEDTDSTHEEQSPQNPRLSRDAQSIVTSASVSESHESLDRSTSGTPSEAATPAAHKESLMQRLSRKGSSSKFNVPWGKERSSFFSRKTGEPSTPNGTPHVELEEDTGSEKHDESPRHPVEKSSRSSLSWPNIRRKSKRNGILATEAKDTDSEGGKDEDSI